MFTNRTPKGIATLWLIIAGFVLIAGSGWWYYIDDIKPKLDKIAVACKNTGGIYQRCESRYGRPCPIPCKCPEGKIWDWRHAENGCLQKSEDTTKNDTSTWKTYRNEKYGFELKYPSNLEVIEGKALFYSPSELPRIFNVCFAPTLRDEFYCEEEFYIVSKNQHFYTDSDFLGSATCSQEKTSYFPRFDGAEGKELDTCASDGRLMVRNSLVERGGYIYLFSTEKDVQFHHNILSTFRFLE